MKRRRKRRRKWRRRKEERKNKPEDIRERGLTGGNWPGVTRIVRGRTRNRVSEKKRDKWKIFTPVQPLFFFFPILL